jgi:hypothetical protein
VGKVVDGMTFRDRIKVSKEKNQTERDTLGKKG